MKLHRVQGKAQRRVNRLVQYQSSPPTHVGRLILLPHVPMMLYLAYVGILGLLSGGLQTPHEVVHPIVAWAWTASLAGGGLLSAYGASTCKTRQESAGLALVVFGLLFYGYLGFVYIPSERLGLVSAVLALAGMCGIRLRVLTLARRAQSIAARIQMQEQADVQHE